MTTMLDCIRRTAPTVFSILENARSYTDDLIRVLGNRIHDFNELILVGSGSSFNASVTAQNQAEKFCGMNTEVILPNRLNKKTVYNPNALYLFLSQTGTSTLVEKQVTEIRKKGFFTLAVSDEKDSPVVRAAEAFVPLGVGGEEFGMRTVGFVSSVVAVYIVALRLGLERGHISEMEYEEYLADGKKAAENHPLVVEKTLEWWTPAREALFSKARSILYYGSDELYGIAIEGALKMLETAKHPLSIGYEAEDGLHGPTGGFVLGDVIIGLNDGEKDYGYTKSIVRFGKGELEQAFMFGPEAVDEKDLVFPVKSQWFRAVEFAPAVEIVSYLTALSRGVELLPSSQRKPSTKNTYFQTHSSSL